jgi:hypothetical protein
MTKSNPLLGACTAVAVLMLPDWRESKGAGWREIARTRGGSWNVRSRPRKDKHPIGPKKRYEVRA